MRTIGSLYRIKSQKHEQAPLELPVFSSFWSFVLIKKVLKDSTSVYKDKIPQMKEKESKNGQFHSIL